MTAPLMLLNPIEFIPQHLDVLFIGAPVGPEFGTVAIFANPKGCRAVNRLFGGPEPKGMWRPLRDNRDRFYIPTHWRESGLHVPTLANFPGNTLERYRLAEAKTGEDFADAMMFSVRGARAGIFSLERSRYAVIDENLPGFQA
jgi:hypothetical protein